MAEVREAGLKEQVVKEKDQIKSQPSVGTSVSNNTSTNKKKAPGLAFRRLFTKPGVSPYDDVEWELRTASITDSQGGIIFEQKNVEVPKDWSMTATNIVASKYLHGRTGERETGVRQLVARVAESIRSTLQVLIIKWAVAAPAHARPAAAGRIRGRPPTKTAP